MEWTRSDTIALASHSCALCQGLGLRINGKGLAPRESSDEPLAPAARPCNCVLRNIFRACYTRFQECASGERFISHVSLEGIQGRETKGTWGRKDEEYIADFCLVSRRSLSESDYRIFKYHYLLGADWKLCCRKLNLDRGNFFHAIYRIEEKLGRVFRELTPYALFPLNDYFNGDKQTVRPFLNGSAHVIPIRPPVSRPETNPYPQQKVA